MKTKILITIGSFFPGFKIGGPAITIKNLLSAFEVKENYEFFIFCPNHDWGDSNAYASVKSNEWVTYSNNCKIFYASEEFFNAGYFKNIISNFDVIYCTGAFTKFAISAGKFARKHKTPRVVIAPMGSFFTNVINMQKSKMIKKKIFFLYTKLLKIFNSCVWSATSEEEAAAVRTIYGNKAKIVIAEDAISFSDSKLIQRDTKSDFLKVVHISRIHEKKGLSACIDILLRSKQNIVFDVYGTIEEQTYFDFCVEKAKQLPNNVRFSYKGSFLPEKVTEIFSKYDVFLFPTKSENFGHVVYESLKSSCIPVMSDTTPWTFIKDIGCGFVYQLSDIEKFSSKLDEIALFDCGELNSYKLRCYQFAKKKFDDSIVNSPYEVFFK